MGAELVIVGAGPAGVSAALWARSRNLDALVLEARESPGGQLHHIHFEPRELPGVVAGAGPDLAALYAEQIREAGVAARYGVRVARFDSGREAVPALATEAGERVEAQAVMIATGVRRRRLDVPGERELEGRGVSYSATRDRDTLRGKAVAVVGGGDAGYENALILAAAGCDVALIVRGEPRARREFRERVAAEPRIRVVEDTSVTAIQGDGRVEAVALSGSAGATSLPVAGVVVKVGDVPNTEWCRGAVGLDPDGFVIVDGSFRTTRDRVWAAGDVIKPPLPSISVAIGTAALAVADIYTALRGE